MLLVQYTASLPGGSGQCNSYNALPHRLGAVGIGTPAMRPPTNRGDGDSCLGGGRCPKSGTRAMHCHTVRGQCGSGTHVLHCHTTQGQWARKLLQCIAPLPGGTRYVYKV